MTASQPSICVEQLTYIYKASGRNISPVVATDNLSFTVNRGETFGLLGPNGAGKTTLIRQLLGLQRPTSGHITIEGIDVVRTPDQVRHLIGFLPQSGVGMRAVEVEGALRLTGRLRGMTERDARSQAQWLIRELELTAYTHHRVQHLSGGLHRLVDCAMALMGWPPLLILDEPTNELDPYKRHIIWELLHRLNIEQGTTCVLVTHNVLEAEKVLQRVGVMADGKMIVVGTPTEIKQRVGRNVRLDFQVKDERHELTAIMHQLSALGSIKHVRAGAYRLYIDEQHIVAAAGILTGQLGLDNLDDFRLSRPSLEDVYLALDSREAGVKEILQWR